MRPIIVTLLLVLVETAAGHDFWIEPSSYVVNPGASVALRLRVGENFEGATVVRSEEHISRFFSLGPGAETAIGGVEGIDPAGFLRQAKRGFYVVGYLGNPTFIELEADKFEKYLSDQGLEHIVEYRREHGDSDQPGRELFSRCAKTFIRVGSNSDQVPFGRALGFPLEILPLTNPYANGVVQSLSIRLSYLGAPVEGALVIATARGGASSTVRARTDAKGRAVLQLDRPDTWLVNAVHMVATKAGSGADWHSWWASLTFKSRENSL